MGGKVTPWFAPFVPLRVFGYNCLWILSSRVKRDGKNPAYGNWEDARGSDEEAGVWLIVFEGKEKKKKRKKINDLCSRENCCGRTVVSFRGGGGGGERRIEDGCVMYRRVDWNHSRLDNGHRTWRGVTDNYRYRPWSRRGGSPTPLPRRFIKYEVLLIDRYYTGKNSRINL